jgi:hypothetical protein
VLSIALERVNTKQSETVNALCMYIKDCSRKDIDSKHLEIVNVLYVYIKHYFRKL